MVNFEPLNVSQRKNRLFSLTARLSDISKIWKKTTQNRFILNILTKFQVSTLREWGCSRVTTTYIQTEKLFRYSDMRFKKNAHTSLFFYTDRYSSSNATKYVSYERWFIGDSYHFVYFLLRLLLLAISHFFWTSPTSFSFSFLIEILAIISAWTVCFYFRGCYCN